MCFSAEASFIASGVLAGTSVAISRLPKPRSNLPVAIIPAVFATHQFVEGLIWLKQDEPENEPFIRAAIITYVLIAYVFWPVFIPFAMHQLESERWRRNWILACQAAGLVAGLAYLSAMIRNPVSVSVYSCNLSYSITAPRGLFFPYLVAVALPFIISSHKGLVLFGIAVLASCASALYLESLPSFPSVWCFFAASLSAGLYFFFRAEARSRTNVDDFEIISRPLTS